MRKRVWVGTIVAIVLLLVGWYVAGSYPIRLYHGTFYPYAAEVPVRFSVARIHLFASSRLAFRYRGNSCIYLCWRDDTAGHWFGGPRQQDRSNQGPRSATDEKEVTESESLTADHEEGP